MKLQITGRLVIGLLTVVGASSAHAEKYIVTFKDKSTYAQVHSQYVMSQRMKLSGTRLFGALDVEVEDSLKHLGSIVVDGKAADIQKLEASGLVQVEKEFFHPAPAPVQGFQPWKPWSVNVGVFAASTGVKTPYGIKLVKAPEAWDVNGRGAGARTLVLDTGADSNHPALKANFEEGKDFTVAGESSDITDQVGHGTHVAGTVAAVMDVDGFSGVAPESKFLMGKVCGVQGCSNIAVARGINWGIEKGVDVITMSLGGPLGSLSEKRAVELADAAGITVVAASGNDGTSRVSYPAAFPTVIAVGAVNDHSARAEFSQYGPELDVMAPGVAVVSSVPQGSGRESNVQVTGANGLETVKSAAFAGSPEVLTVAINDLVDAGLGKPEDFTPAVQGKYALIQRGEIAFADKVKNAITAGAAGAIIYNNAPGLIQGALTQDGSTVAIPAMMIEQQAGEALKAILASGGTAQASMLTIKTDYAAFDGTSMATPHVAGVMALVKAANKLLTPEQVRQIVATTSSPIGVETEYAKGLINAEAAVKAALATSMMSSL